MLIYANLSSSFWSEFIAVDCYITNRLWIKALNSKTPYKAWYKKKPNKSNLCIYGCNKYVVDNHIKSKEKIAQQSWSGILVGYERKYQWKIYNNLRVLIYKNVIFNKSKFGYKDLFGKQSELVGGSLIEYINIAELFLPIGESANPIVHQYLFRPIQAKDDDHDEVTHELKKSFSSPIPLENPVDDVFDIVNSLLKEKQ